MKVIHLNTSDIQGGAARGAYKIHISLRKIGVDSEMVVDKKISDDPHVYGLKGKISEAWSKVRPFIDRAPLKSYNRQETTLSLARIGRNIARNELVKQADIINLHWIAGGFLSIKGISRLANLGKPVVWTLHDMWAFTGGCHYSGDCKKYINSCGSCPQLNSDKENDITRKIWRRKKEAYKDLCLTIAPPSKWLAECAKRSSLLSDLQVEVIPHGLNTDIFKPIDKLMARDILNLPKNKRIILFGAMSATTDKRKGFKYLKEAISNLEKSFNKDELCLVIFGASHAKDIEKFPFEVKFLGRLHDDFSLALSYSAADVCVIPSIQDNFPNTVRESLSCGIPVVAFNIGGMPDMIEHQVNGYLSNPKDANSLSTGIEWVLEDNDRAFKLAEAAREKALKEYTLEIQAKRYKSLFDSLVKS